jgi:surface polysaccharide O-acyltransferase-like enzyme
MDALKAIAIIAVILIHTITAWASHYQTPNTWQYNVNLIINQLLRFSVPLFVALSGYGLAKGYPDGVGLNYFWRRCIKILPPFLFWSTIFYILNLLYPNFIGINYLGQPAVKTILLGRADYHLYFVPMIFGLYLVYPILLFLVKKFPLFSVLCSLFIEILWYWHISNLTEIPTNWNNIFPDAQQYLNPLSWIFYFVLGIYLSVTSKKIPAVLGLCSVLGSLLIILWSMFDLLGAGMDIIVATRFTRLPVLFYATSFIILFLGRNFSNKIFDHLGKISFQTYLLHTLIIRLVFAYLPTKDLGVIITTLLIIAGSFTSALILTWAYSRLIEIPKKLICLTH